MPRTSASTKKKATSAEITAGKKQLTKALRDKPNVHVECRSMRHAWRQKNVIRFRAAQTRRDLPVLVMDLECLRGCGVIRQDMFIVKKKGANEYEIIERMTPTYSYPEAYQIPGVPRGVQPSIVLWQEFIRRQAETVANAEPGERGTPEA